MREYEILYKKNRTTKWKIDQSTNGILWTKTEAKKQIREYEKDYKNMQYKIRRYKKRN